jgi:uncharacterized SAM-binding protein YcdF (DUF218 family)
MSFILSKVLWPLTTPSNLLALLLVLGGLLALGRWRRLGRRLLGLCLAAIVLLMIFPLDLWLTLPLEKRFPAPDPLPARVHGIVVLGGGVTHSEVPVLGGTQLNGAADRLSALVMLARRYPEARIVYTGGNATLAGGAREADAAALLLTGMGFATPRLEYERESRNTHENALFTMSMVKPAPGETWLLVTSARHMPRSVGVFRRQGWSPVPLPVDFSTEGEWRLIEPAESLAGRLGGIDGAVREWIGLIAYRLLGYTDQLFPGPER